MKTFSKNICSHLAVFCAVVCLLQSAAAAPTKASPVAVNTNTVVEVPKSVFNDKAGKDPFFPRRNRMTAQAQPAAHAVNASDFNLQGVQIGTKITTCIINTRTFEKNESGEVKLPNGRRSKIRVLDIKEDSVVIKIENSCDPGVLTKRRGQL